MRLSSLYWRKARETEESFDKLRQLETGFRWPGRYLLPGSAESSSTSIPRRVDAYRGAEERGREKEERRYHLGETRSATRLNTKEHPRLLSYRNSRAPSIRFRRKMFRRVHVTAYVRGHPREYVAA